MSDWNKIKNKLSELNTKTILNPIDKKPLDNELVMCLFCNKINLKYRFEPYYEVPFIDYTTRMFNTIIYDNIDDNFFTVASSDKLINTYINSIKNVLITKINIAFQNNPDLKKDYNINNFDKNTDKNLILVSAIDNLNMDKYKKLSEMLYNIDNKYLDYAKESIINSNKNMSLDKMLYGIDIPEHFINTINNRSFYIINIILIIIIVLIILIKCIH